MRWILLAAAIAGFGIAFTTTSPGLMGLGLIVGCAGLLGFGLALAASRIAQTAQSETALIVDPEIRALRAKASLAKSLPRVSAPPVDRTEAGNSDTPS